MIFTLLFFCITVNSSARYSNLSRHHSTLSNDSIPQKIVATARDTVPEDSSLTDSIPFRTDSAGQRTDTIHLAFSKDSLDGPITYSAADSVVLDVPTKNVTLYNKANAKYKDIDLNAYEIRMDQQHQLLTASFIRDTANRIIGKPKMKQAESTIESDSMIFNMKTQKGITVNSLTQSGEMYVMGEKMKKISKDEYYAFHGRFTTCNLDTPHFAFRTNKMKLINKKMAITGPVHPEFEGVPLPIYIPFGFFPLSQGRHSGMLAPTFNVSSQYGLGLEGLGYYKVLNDNFDAALRANLYSYGGYSIFFTPEYRVRYRYSGRVNFNYQLTRLLSDNGKSPYQDTKTYSLSWSHVVDSKARPGQTFSANLNLMSTKYNSTLLNNPTANFSNQVSSSIAYSKTWNGKYNLTVSGNHSQNNQTGLVNVNVPSIGFTAVTIYPFAPKELVGKPKWYQKLGIGLNTNVTGLTSFYDSLFSIHHLLDTFQYGAQNNIPISLSLPPLGALQISPGVSFQNRILSRKYDFGWDEGKQKVDTSFNKGVYFANSVSFSLGFSTAIFGTFQHFGKKSNILGIRHTIRPTFGFSFTPDLAKSYYKNIQVDNLGHYQNINLYSGNVYSAFSPGTFGGINFGVDNNLEMKVKSKTDTTSGANQKMKLIDGFGFTGSYNYLADSFKLSTFNIYFRSTLFQKINITASTVLDPYQYDSAGFRLDKYTWQGKGGFNAGHITGGNIAISTSFKSKPKDQKKADEEKKGEDSQLPMTLEEQQAELNYIRSNPGEFVDFNISWSVNISYSLNFNRVLKTDYKGYMTNLTSSLILNGDFNLTEKWKMGFNTYYDVKNLKIQSLTGFLSRDMHCWQMSINVTPVGIYRSFSITLNPKSSILRDLRINRNRTFN
ncbi:MAG: putative LPS assembly protein LptD [Bacteroidota bacterium]|nr:putative LPS assembly protein LptD [Bacteroidota bacterium]